MIRTHGVLLVEPLLPVGPRQNWTCTILVASVMATTCGTATPANLTLSCPRALVFVVCVTTLQVVSLLVSSHYKNTPNDLLLLADAPAHQLFVLLGPVDETQNAMPDVLAVLQV